MFDRIMALLVGACVGATLVVALEGLPGVNGKKGVMQFEIENSSTMAMQDLADLVIKRFLKDHPGAEVWCVSFQGGHWEYLPQIRRWTLRCVLKAQGTEKPQYNVTAQFDDEPKIVEFGAI